MKARPLYYISLLTGLLPMLTGSIIFWIWFYYPNWHELELWGLRIIKLSIPICVLGLILTSILGKKNQTDSRSAKKATRVTLLIFGNIPLAAFYVWFALYIMDTERITINNNSDSDIENIHIFGVGNNDRIAEIKRGKSKLVWVHMTESGLIKMKYSQNGKTDTTYLSGYTGPMMGGSKSEHNVQWTKEDQQ